VAALDRLTRCLIQEDRQSEASEEAERYFREFPEATQLQAGRDIKARIKKHRRQL
jgi:hypothetical protein